MNKRLTRHRQTILENMKSRMDHPTAKMVFESLHSSSRLSFATVYNSLEYLVNQGYIKKLDINSDSSRYDAVMSAHAHMVCDHCRTVYDSPGQDAAKILFENITDFQIEDISITIHGKCAACIRLNV
ncbi:MAG TPA: transcriptional repressor [Leptospiraceae bacterium]|nr:transcriptional repressor [Leptospiraceae bacterium]HMY66826.1 transcriptional repressor [Leptospiraceae bacterium]HNF15135.1 transcriptional repressor [Leptospiraceae bacterium]HNF27673.1 transcriptional repressor [Leptospiraceae bacterium]HNI97336.1 transcriptional repressor [Leptospiraceae bacterium]